MQVQMSALIGRRSGQCQGERVAAAAPGRGQRDQAGQPRGLPGVAADGLRQVKTTYKYLFYG